MPELSLGRLDEVDLRKVWPKEDVNFTPWLAQEGNIAMLGDTIGLELEVESHEKHVGPFRADILCKDTASENWVVIENQLERTDHTHLGQLVTYASGLNAATVVWVAKRFTDEHRAALDWLNDVTGEEIAFFGLEVELWQIGDSKPAPKFNIVSSPNEWTKSGSPGKKSGDGVRLEYWTLFCELVLKQAKELKPGKVRDQAALTFSTGRHHIDYRVQAARLEGGRISVGLAVHGKQAEVLYNILKSNQAAIEADLAMPVKWTAIPNRNLHQLRTFRTAETENHADWPKQHEWLLTILLHFKSVLDPRIAALPEANNLDDELAGEEE